MLPPLESTLRLRQIGSIISTTLFAIVTVHDLITHASGWVLMKDIGLTVMLGSMAINAHQELGRSRAARECVDDVGVRKGGPR